MNPPGGREHAKFSRKLHEIERIWTPRGGRASLTPPLDLPMLAAIPQESAVNHNREGPFNRSQGNFNNFRRRGHGFFGQSNSHQDATGGFRSKQVPMERSSED